MMRALSALALLAAPLSVMGAGGPWPVETKFAQAILTGERNGVTVFTGAVYVDLEINAYIQDGYLNLNGHLGPKLPINYFGCANDTLYYGNRTTCYSEHAPKCDFGKYVLQPLTGQNRTWVQLPPEFRAVCPGDQPCYWNSSLVGEACKPEEFLNYQMCWSEQRGAASKTQTNSGGVAPLYPSMATNEFVSLNYEKPPKEVFEAPGHCLPPVDMELHRNILASVKRFWTSS